MDHDNQNILKRYLIRENVQQPQQGLQTLLNGYVQQFPQYEQMLNGIKEAALDAAGNIEADAVNYDDPNKEEAAKQLAFFLES